MAWLKDIFDPETKVQVRGDKRLLIVDGHNSHCTLEFILYAVNHDIVVLCLPPHTTHIFQPLDVGIYGPLALAWSKEVQRVKNRGYKITKNNFLSYYSQARDPVFTPDLIASAFERCGIWPINRDVITECDTAPADNTTSQSSQPLPATLPFFVEQIPARLPDPATQYADPVDLNTCNDDDGPHVVYSYHQIDRPTLPSSYAPKQELHAVIQLLDSQLERATRQIGADHAQMKLMDKENGRTRARLYGKTAKRGKVIHLNTGSRILTEAKQLDALIAAEKKKNWGGMMKGAGPIIKARRKVLDAHAKERNTILEEAEKRAVSVAEAEMKALQKGMELMATKRRYLTSMLSKAEQALTKAQRPSEIEAAEKRINRWDADIVVLDEKVLGLQPDLDTATEAYDRLQQARECRLAAIMEIERRYMDAIAHEEAENEVSKKRDEERVARRAKLPQMPKDPLNMWKERWESEGIVEEAVGADMESHFLGAYDLRVPQGWYTYHPNGVGPQLEVNITDDEAELVPEDIPIDPELI